MTLPTIIDRMPLQSRKPRAGPLLEPDEVIACALSMVPYRWSGRMLSENSLPVRAVLQALEMAGYEIVVR
jgi:hypothetical protein